MLAIMQCRSIDMRLRLIEGFGLIADMAASPLLPTDAAFLLEGISAGPAGAFVEEFSRLVDRHAAVAPIGKEYCAVPEVQAEGIGRISLALTRSAEMNVSPRRGGDGIVFTSSNPPKRYAVKLIYIASTIEQMAREKAFRMIAGDLRGGTVASYGIVEGSMSHACLLRTLVSDYGGNTTLAHFSIKGNKLTDLYGTELTQSAVAAIAVKVIGIVRDVHALGMLHADIHGRNFIVDDPSNVPDGIKIIDFGASQPYIDPQTGMHIRNRIGSPPDGNPFFQSPYVLEGSRISRRDDMYRVSELLYHILGGSRDFTTRPTKAAKRKREWRLREPVYSIFNDFHHAMCILAFTERPDYQGWIDRFTLVALQTLHDGEL